MKIEKLIKKLGYGYAVSFNDYNKKFVVYRIGEWSVGCEVKPDTKMTQSKSAKKAIKKYMKKYRKV